MKKTLEKTIEETLTNRPVKIVEELKKDFCKNEALAVIEIAKNLGRSC